MAGVFDVFRVTGVTVRVCVTAVYCVADVYRVTRVLGRRHVAAGSFIGVSLDHVRDSFRFTVMYTPRGYLSQRCRETPTEWQGQRSQWRREQCTGRITMSVGNERPTSDR